MKTLNALLCLCIPFYFFAQNDNYCPCQETQSNYEVLFEWSVQVHEQRKPVNLPPVFHQPSPRVMQEPVIVPVTLPVIEQENKTEIIPEEESEPEIDESRINIAPEKVNASNSSSSSAQRSKVRKKNKLFKGKVKKRKKTKKYKGKCPAF